MKHLPKHLRPKWRYVAVGIETDPDVSLDRGAFQRELWYAAQNLLGDAGSADADGTVVRFQFADGDGRAVVRARRDHVEPLRAALACIESVGDATSAISILGVSGTIRACEDKYVDGPSDEVERREVVFEGATRSAVVGGDRLAVDADGRRAYATVDDVE
ncbi:ribonuclease P [Halorubellus sp. JP-L1]|uniref:Rpp14/Pop5 family protein n=1 Tax=Halorubellus sp. JP-L1 TaxID=2715753 RepID=UPI00140D9B2B|nr:Rpp14/Pop5 family protein [Halorubellus sp. JP-L1]NHN40315.1 ribonuclease P [Halorubellus sp. JP-L1]